VSDTPAIVVRGLVKRYPGVTALSGLDLDFAGGGVTAVLGENGAGKSTLMSILAGLQGPDEGTIHIHGVPVERFQPHALLTEHRVALVPQELSLCGDRTVAQNVVLGAEPGRFPRAGAMRARTRALLAELESSLDPDVEARRLGVAEQQLVVLARALARDATTIIFDEPTAALTLDESERLFALVERLRARGMTILYVTHRLPEVFRLSSTIHVLRDGALAASFATSECTPEATVRAMVGRELAEVRPPSDALPAGGPLRLQARRLTGSGFSRVDLSVSAGELVGLAGLPDSGRGELLAALFGASPATDGSIELDGAPVRLRTPRDGIRAGIAYVPAERRSQGILSTMSVADNVVALDLAELGRGGLVSVRRARRLAAERLGAFDVRGQAGQPIATLSGGNQQKAILARWIGRRPRLVLLDEPTRGIDVGAKAEIYALLEQLAQEGAAVVVSSSDLTELLRITMRIAVMHRGEIAGIVEHDDATEERLLSLATGLKETA
jgi:ABC-type sugar transport system ATPase subunit